jgi:hypothetical protein
VGDCCLRPTQQFVHTELVQVLYDIKWISSGAFEFEKKQQTIPKNRSRYAQKKLMLIVIRQLPHFLLCKYCIVLKKSMKYIFCIQYFLLCYLIGNLLWGECRLLWDWLYDDSIGSWVFCSRMESSRICWQYSKFC